MPPLTYLRIGNYILASPTLPAYATVGGVAHRQPEVFYAYWIIGGPARTVTGMFHLN